MTTEFSNKAYGKPDNTTLAVLSVVLSVFALSIGDAIIKGFSVNFTLWQVYVLRSCVALGILLVVIKLRYREHKLWPRSAIWVMTRSFLLCVMWVLYYSALPHIELSVAAAIYYSIPLFITLFSAIFIGDNVSAKSWFAIGIGFTGVVVIVRPDTDGFNSYMLLPLAAAILYALAMILTRTKCLLEEPLVLSLSLNVMFIAMGSVATLATAIWVPETSLVNEYPFLLGDWLQLDVTGCLIIGALGIVMVVGSTFAAIAYQNAKPSVVASFDYSYLVFSALWGILFFSEAPDSLTILGIALIVFAGLFSIWLPKIEVD